MEPGFRFGKSDNVLVPVASQAKAWSGTDIEGDDVVMYIVKLTGANNVLSNVLRARVKADSQPIIDVSYPDHFVSYMKRASSGGYTAGASDVYLLLPLYVMEAKSDEERYASAFPRGKRPTVELLYGAAALTTPTSTLYWVQRPDIKHPLYPLFFTEPMNIQASATNGKDAFTRKGAVRHMSMILTHLTSGAIVVNGDQVDLFDAGAYGYRDAVEQGSASTAAAAFKYSPAIPENSVIKFASMVTDSSWDENVEVGTYAYDAAPTP